MGKMLPLDHGLYRLTNEDITVGSPGGSINYGAAATGYAGYDKVGNRRSRKVSTSALTAGTVTDFNNGHEQL
jgi:hypothetical protein